MLQSGLNENWCADSMECKTYLRNVTDLLSDGKTPYERHFGQPFKGLIIPGGSLVDYHPITAKDQSRIHQFGKKVLPGLFLGYALYAGGNLEGWRTGCRPWGVGDDGRIGNLFKKDSMRKRWCFPKKKENLFSNRRWANQICWMRSRPENIHLDTAASNSRRMSRWFSWRITRVSFTTSWLISGCLWSDKWLLVHVRKLHIPPSRWTTSQTLLAEIGIIPYSTESKWRLQNYSYEFGCQARETHRWIMEYRWVSRLVWSMDRFHLIYSFGRKTSKRTCVVRCEINEKNSWHPGQNLWPELWEKMGKNAKLKEKQKWSHEKLHLDNARKLRGIYFIDPEDKEF